MTAFPYVDTSALGKLVLHEPESGALRAYLTGHGHVVDRRLLDAATAAGLPTAAPA